MGVSHYYPSNLTKGARCPRAGVLSLPGYFYFPSPAKKTPGAAIMAGGKNPLIGRNPGKMGPQLGHCISPEAESGI
jgi:hypothetical protein